MSTVLLLHAFPFSAQMWWAQRAALQAAGHRVVAPDLPGFGATAPLAAPGLEGFARHALGELDRSGAERAVVCGLSMGGYVALRLCAEAPARVAGLVLADTKAAADTDEQRRRRLEQAARVEREGSAWLADELLPLLVGPQAPASLQAGVHAMMAAAPPAGVAGALRAMAARPDSTPLLAHLNVPAAVIVGAHDGLTGPEVMRAVADGIAGATFTLLEGAGHLANLEAPEPFNAALLDLVGRSGGGSTAHPT